MESDKYSSVEFYACIYNTQTEQELFGAYYKVQLIKQFRFLEDSATKLSARLDDDK